MRLATVETPNGLDRYASIYYDTPQHFPPGSRLDAGSETLGLWDAVLDVVRMGDDPSDVLDATLIWAAYQSTLEMQVSVTADPLLDALRAVHGQLSAEAILDAVERASARLRGAALIGCLRSIANVCSRVREYRLREIAMDVAWSEMTKARPKSVFPMLQADEAHMRFRQAELVLAIKDDERVRVASALAESASSALARAWTYCLVERWNPFVLHRLKSEVKEHSSQLASPWDATTRQLVNLADQVWDEASRSWSKLTRALKDDLEAYFYVDRTLTSPISVDQLPVEAQSLITYSSASD